MKQEVVPVDQQLNTILQQQIAKNRTIMASLFKTVLFCGRNNIAFRGSRDEDPSNESLKGNFQALLYFRVESGDTVLQEHFETASRNATYVSKTIQNEMITTLVNISRINYLQRSKQVSTFLLSQMEPPMYQTKRISLL